MKERFKRFLEREFRAISPTLAAMEYRQQMLEQMMARAQELRIKGITDDELIYDMVIDELGDLRSKLVAFENNNAREKKGGIRKSTLIIALVIGAIALLTCAYLVTSFALGNAWGKTWLIMVGGVFAGIVGAALFISVKAFAKEKVLIARACIAVSIVLVSVFVFLLLQILFALPYSWFVFLVMVIVMLALDTFIAMFSGNKLRFIELGVFMEVFCVLLYVILGITGLMPWHPGWLLCLLGVLGIVVEIIVLIARYNSRKKAEEKVSHEEKYAVKDEDYYTMWKD